MGTRIKVRRVLNGIGKNPTVPIASASLAVSSANLSTNLHRNKKEAEFRRDQLQATKDLTNSLLKVDKSLKKTESNKKYEDDNRFIKFIPFNNYKK